MCVLLKSHRYVAIVDIREEIVVAAAAHIEQEICPDQKLFRAWHGNCAG
jgi:hypothetical protein